MSHEEGESDGHEGGDDDGGDDDDDDDNFQHTCNKELSGENMTMAWAIRSENPMVMRVGCHEKRSLPGTAVYTWYLVFTILFGNCLVIGIYHVIWYSP